MRGSGRRRRRRDLAELRLHLGRHADCFDGREDQVALISVIDRRRGQLQSEAFALGQKIYRRRPQRFVEAMERRWRKGTWALPAAG